MLGAIGDVGATEDVRGILRCWGAIKHVERQSEMPGTKQRHWGQLEMVWAI